MAGIPRYADAWQPDSQRVVGGQYNRFGGTRTDRIATAGCTSKAFAFRRRPYAAGLDGRTRHSPRVKPGRQAHSESIPVLGLSICGVFYSTCYIEKSSGSLGYITRREAMWLRECISKNRRENSRGSRRGT